MSRKEGNGEEAVNKIKESATGQGSVPDVTFVQCDLGDLKMVKQVADKLNNDEGRMDLVSRAFPRVRHTPPLTKTTRLSATPVLVSIPTERLSRVLIGT